MSSQSVRAARRHHDSTPTGYWRSPGHGMSTRGQGSALVLMLTAFLISYLIIATPIAVAWSVLLPLIVLSGVMHHPAQHGAVVLSVLGCITAGMLLVPGDLPGTIGALVAGVVIAGVTMWRSQARASVGVNGRSGERLIDEMRSGLRRRSALPVLGEGWLVEGAVVSAHGHPFSGDFIVSYLSEDGSRFEAALVDVSGKGLQSASRAVSLSGALEALMGAVPADEFLAAANDYVNRQGWSEGYATAVHLAVDLDTGAYEIRRAGHPPAALFRGGRGAWGVVEDHSGPALGLLESPRFGCDSGVLGPRDAILLYSDGLVERHDRSLDDGIDRLLGEAARLVMGGFVGGPEHLCAQAAAGNSDDRSVVLLWRT